MLNIKGKINTTLNSINIKDYTLSAANIEKMKEIFSQPESSGPIFSGKVVETSKPLIMENSMRPMDHLNRRWKLVERNCGLSIETILEPLKGDGFTWTICTLAPSLPGDVTGKFVGEQIVAEHNRSL